MRRPLLLALLPCLAAALSTVRAAEAPPRVVVSIAPLHSLVAMVTGDVTEPHLIVPAGQSPHTFSLAPSDARALSRAGLVVMAGGATDRFLERPLEALAGDADIIELLGLSAVRPLPARSGGVWHEAHDHGDGHDDHGDANGLDPHAWLDPRHGVALVDALATRLARTDPANAETYRGNAARAKARLKELDQQLAGRLAPVADRPYLVFHDAYQYFERRYGLSPVGSIVVDPGRPPGARRLASLRDRIREGGVACLFIEPQFEPRIARSVAEGTPARIAELDPLGAGLEAGPGLYPTLLRRMADALRGCLKPAAGV